MGWGLEGEMTQALYAHMNNNNKKKQERKKRRLLRVWINERCHLTVVSIP
jgi:hypothetical protein